MEHLSDEVLARALAVICGATSRRRGDIITDPYTPLDEACIPRDAIMGLIKRRCLVGRGRLQFKIVLTELPPLPPPMAAQPAALPNPPSAEDDEPPAVPETPAASDTATPMSEPAAPTQAPPSTARTGPPRFLLVIDAENVVRTCRDLRSPFRPELIRELAGQCGEIAFAFALGNLLALNQRDRELLTLAGFPLLHCARLTDGNGGKDTVDEHAFDLIRRFLEYGMVDGVVLVTDDRNFIPIMVSVRDHGRRLVRIAVRRNSELDRIGEVRYLPLAGEELTDVTPSSPANPWVPQVVIDGLQEMVGISTPSDRDRAIRNLDLRAPFVCRILRTFLRRWWRSGYPSRRVSFPTLLEEFTGTVPPEDHAHVTADDLRAFLTALVDIGLIGRHEYEREGQTRRGYAVNWEHPFCVPVAVEAQEQRSRWQRPRPSAGTGK